MRVAKEKINLSNGEYAYYVKVLDFKDEIQWEVMGKKIESLVKDSTNRTQVW